MSTPPFLQNIYQKPTMDAEGQQTNGEYTKVAHDDTHDDPPPFHSSRSNNGNDDSEEMLPLYTEMHARHSASDSITPPAATATPDQVRDFIVELLTTTRGLHIDHARRVAARWTLGNGQEMRAYPPWMYRDIFGFEDGWIVYKEVHVVLHNATRSRRRATGSMSFLPPDVWVDPGLKRVYLLTCFFSCSDFPRCCNLVGCGCWAGFWAQPDG